MIEKDDWRLTGQEKFLMGVKLRYESFRNYCPNRDHDHCIFCTEKFIKEGDFGYCTLDGYYWICEACYEDFKFLFKWDVIKPKEIIEK